MIKIKLSENWTEYLLGFPETGMGYQNVNVILKTGETIQNVVVLNAEEIILSERYSGIKEADIIKIMRRM